MFCVACRISDWQFVENSSCHFCGCKHMFSHGHYFVYISQTNTATKNTLLKENLSIKTCDSIEMTHNGEWSGSETNTWLRTRLYVACTVWFVVPFSTSHVILIFPRDWCKIQSSQQIAGLELANQYLTATKLQHRNLNNGHIMYEHTQSLTTLKPGTGIFYVI